jgi:phosphoribosyl-ATP pyrophosphohydrolase/phosphoribosyl-AMP cyclohydrolase/histidinol dehydrogenase
MDTTLPLPFLPYVDLEKGATEAKEGLTRVQLSYLGVVYFSVNEKTIDTLLQFLQRHSSVEAYVNVTAIDSTDNIITCLNAGARRVFVKISQVEELKSYGERVIPVLSQRNDSTQNTSYENGVLVEARGKLSDTKSIIEKLAARKISPVFLLSASKSGLQEFVEFAIESSVIPIIPATSLTVGEPTKDQVSITELIGKLWVSDRPDKLIPTVVTDESGVALGLVYSSQESVAETLKTGKGVYQSRKRGLWYKGATSGDTQEVVRISLDCDQDCLKFVVRQKGRGKPCPRKAYKDSID